MLWRTCACIWWQVAAEVYGLCVPLSTSTAECWRGGAASYPLSAALGDLWCKLCMIRGYAAFM
jgi:hypothetical protein